MTEKKLLLTLITILYTLLLGVSIAIWFQNVTVWWAVTMIVLGCGWILYEVVVKVYRKP